MDWSFFKSGSKHPLLRSDLIYPNAIPVRNHHPLVIPSSLFLRPSFTILLWLVCIRTRDSLEL